MHCHQVLVFIYMYMYDDDLVHRSEKMQYIHVSLFSYWTTYTNLPRYFVQSSNNELNFTNLHLWFPFLLQMIARGTWWLSMAEIKIIALSSQKYHCQLLFRTLILIYMYLLEKIKNFKNTAKCHADNTAFIENVLMMCSRHHPLYWHFHEK